MTGKAGLPRTPEQAALALARAKAATSPAVREALAQQALDAGASTSEVGALLGVDAHTVRRHFAHTDQSGPRRRADISDADIRALVVEGLGQRAIAAELGCSRNLVVDRMIQMGLSNAKAPGAARRR